MWTLLLQSVILGKAREVYTAFSVHQSLDYDVIKGAILKAYELVPEAYRQKQRCQPPGNFRSEIQVYRWQP